MVLIIAFLTLTNIALGYGLAIYVNRHFGTLLWSRSKSAVTAPSVEIATSVTEKQDKKGITPDAETSATEPVVEEKVLAGIEEFRSQLAKMNGTDEQPTDQLATGAPEMATAAT